MLSLKMEEDGHETKNGMSSRRWEWRSSLEPAREWRSWSKTSKNSNLPKNPNTYERDSPLDPLEKMTACWHLGFISDETHTALLFHNTVTLYICVVLPHESCYKLLPQQQETNTILKLCFTYHHLFLLYIKLVLFVMKYYYYYFLCCEQSFDYIRVPGN